MVVDLRFGFNLALCGNLVIYMLTCKLHIALLRCILITTGCRIWQRSVDYSQVIQPEVQQESSLDFMMQDLFGSAYSPPLTAMIDAFRFLGANF
ncbi:hypothetical protein GOBAR_DD16072 [Gossypium barbadense]|nr:hypothetical protein GOBAR_DD16072 [Gossypium barbadense]